MKEIKIAIKNGRGIKSFQHDFNFDGKSNFYGLYAQNGTMKSSFAKVLDEYSRGERVRDHLFDIEGECVVSGIDADNILSFPCYEGGARLSPEAELLVANAEAKEIYDQAFKETKEAYELFEGKLVSIAQSVSLGGEQTVNAFYRSFVNEKTVEVVTVPHVVQLLTTSKPEIEAGNSLFAEVSYARFTHSNFSKFIESKKYAGLYKELAETYDELRKSPTYYRDGFDASSAVKLSKELNDSKYFDASHEIVLKKSDGAGTVSVKNGKELEEALRTDLDLILAKKPHLKKPLSDLIKDFSVGTNGDVRKIFENPAMREILVFMGMKDRFYKNMWYGYLSECAEEIEHLIAVHKKSSKDISDALLGASESVSEWETVKDIFNERFRNLPYEIHIVNKADAIVNDLIRPVFEVRFKNHHNPSMPFKERPDPTDKLSTLSTVLSNGERRALFLLNVIYQLRNHMKKEVETLVVLDDIVESFDYKNKYAFFEYLLDLTDVTTKMYIVILTHNFDFYRLVYEKIFPRNEDQFKLLIREESGDISVEDMFNPRIFSKMKADAEAGDKLAWITLIPLARNLAEFKGDEAGGDYLDLTKCLHVMPDSPDVGGALRLVEEYTGVSSSPFALSDSVLDATVSVADGLVTSSGNSFSLNENFAYAMAIRIRIERYIIANITSALYSTVLGNRRDQTRGLMKVYLNNSSDTRKAKLKPIFNRGLMMIDGSIHINSFMYEPLIDMGTWELRELYSTIIRETT